MEKRLVIPEEEKRDKILSIKLTRSEHETLKEFCFKNHVNKSMFVRHALRSLLKKF